MLQPWVAFSFHGRTLIYDCLVLLIYSSQSTDYAPALYIDTVYVVRYERVHVHVGIHVIGHTREDVTLRLECLASHGVLSSDLDSSLYSSLLQLYVYRLESVLR